MTSDDVALISQSPSDPFHGLDLSGPREFKRALNDIFRHFHLALWRLTAADVRPADGVRPPRAMASSASPISHSTSRVLSSAIDSRHVASLDLVGSIVALTWLRPKNVPRLIERLLYRAETLGTVDPVSKIFHVYVPRQPSAVH